MCCIHFKTDKVKGIQTLPMPENLVKMFATLDKTLSSSHATPITYFFKQKGGSSYTDNYFSTICSNQLVFNGTRLTSNKLRHLFVTGWKDFMQHPSTFLVRQQVTDLTQAASTMMLNTPEVWGAYDDTTTDRALYSAMAFWPKFQEFMKEQHLDMTSRKPWDPLAADFASLQIT